MSARKRTLLFTCLTVFALACTLGVAAAAESYRGLATNLAPFSPVMSVGVQDPAMSESILCWWDEGAGTSSDERLRVMDLNTLAMVTVQATGSFIYEGGTSVDGRKVVWTDEKLPNGKRTLYGYDVSAKVLKKLGEVEQRDETGSSDGDARPDISGDRVVVSGKHAGQVGVWLVTYSTATWRKLDAAGERPRISGDWAVWLQRVGEWGGDRILVATNVVTNERKTVAISDLRGWDVDGNRLVYAARRQVSTEYGTEYEEGINLWGMDLATGATFTVSDAPGTEASPRLFGSSVVWEEESGDYDDKTRTLHFKSLSTGVGFLVAPDARGVVHSLVTNGTQIAWVEGQWGGASLRLAAIADRAPAKLTISAPKIISWGASTQVRGLLTDAGGNPLAGRMIRLNGYYSQRFNSSLTTITLASVRTGSDGTYAFTVRPLTIGHYTAQFAPGQTDTNGPSATKTVLVAPKPKARLSVPKTARARHTIDTFAYVYAAKGFDGPQPQLQGYRSENGKWIRRYTFDMGWPNVVTRGTYKGWTMWGDRAFATELQDFKPGRWRFRVVVADPDYATAVSSWCYLTAR